MSRKKIIRSSSGSYHIWARANNRESFPVPIHQCWGIYNYYLEQLAKRYQAQIHAFVLMPNHFHLIMSTPNQNIDQCMGYFMTQTSKGIGMASGRINHVYGGQYGWTLIESPSVYAIILKYVYRNPVKAKICDRVEEYSWSTLTNQARRHLIVGRSEFEYWAPKDYDQLIGWLNEDSFPEFESKLWASLKRDGSFKMPRDKNRNMLDMEKYIMRC